MLLYSTKNPEKNISVLTNIFFNNINDNKLQISLLLYFRRIMWLKLESIK